jgi:hypothetical protein
MKKEYGYFGWAWYQANGKWILERYDEYEGTFNSREEAIKFATESMF